jgi:hypothetical protein
LNALQVHLVITRLHMILRQAALGQTAIFSSAITGQLWSFGLSSVVHPAATSLITFQRLGLAEIENLEAAFLL